MSVLTAASSFYIGHKIKYYCKYPLCQNSYRSPTTVPYVNKKFHKFPKEVTLLKQWKHICNIPQENNCLQFRICEDHFLPSDYRSSFRLTSSAIPKESLQTTSIPSHSDSALPSSSFLSHSQNPTDIDTSSLIYLPENPDFSFTLSANEFPHDPSFDTGEIATQCFISQMPPVCFEEVTSASTNFDHSVTDSTAVILEPSNPIHFDHTYCKATNVDSIDKVQGSNSNYTDHTYHKNVKGSSIGLTNITDHSDKYKFLTEDNNMGILTKAGLNSSNLTSEQAIMYRVHRNTTSKLCKLKSLLKNERAELATLKNLYNDGRFLFIEESLSSVTKDFINAQLRNASKPINGKSWTVQDKAFALSLYKRSPRLYKYLRTYFQLPSVRTLKYILSNIPFECGVIGPVIDYLKIQVPKMDELDKYCTLMFDEVSLSKGLHYESSKQRICGFEDLAYKRTNNLANHALVLMIRGIRKTYKQVIAYYFVKDTIKTIDLKHIIVDVIKQLQMVGLHVVATVCDQGATNRAALKALCEENHVRPSPYYFVVNNQRICTIFDVPHLLKNTRNALIDNVIEYDHGKIAKFEHIEKAYTLDQNKRTYKQLSKLKPSYFNFKDSFMKMKVKIAAQQLSQTVAASIETFSVLGDLPPESLNTAEFVHTVDNLFDSLNSSQYFSENCSKKLRSAISHDSPHIEFWSDLLLKIEKWKIISLKDNTCCNKFKFLDGWKTTIKAVMFLWDNLKSVGFKYLPTRNLNQDPLENLFCQIRQHGLCNTNPTCHQFVAAMKTVVINNFNIPLSKSNNCEEDNSSSLGDLSAFIFQNHTLGSEKDVAEFEIDKENFDKEFSSIPDAEGTNQATSYVAGYLLKILKTPDCDNCKKMLYAETPNENHLYVQFKEHDDTMRLNYASDNIIRLTDTIHHRVYKYLDQYGYYGSLEDNLSQCFSVVLNTFQLCAEHIDLKHDFIKKCIRLTIYKYTRDKKDSDQLTRCHAKKMKKFKLL